MAAFFRPSRAFVNRTGGSVRTDVAQGKAFVKFRAKERAPMRRETVYIALFRGVGGKTQLPVKQLKAVLEEAGFARVATYINSGNAVFVSDLAAEAAAGRVAAAVGGRLSFTKKVILRDRGEWTALIAGNPFPEAVGEPTTLHAFALESAPEPAAVAALREKATGTERFVVDGRTLYLHAPDGLGRSKFLPRIETTLNVGMTARNWRTVLALHELAEAAAMV